MDPFDSKIAAEEAKIPELNRQMDAIKELILVAAGKEVAKWYEDQTKSALHWGHEAAEKLTDEQMADLKAKIKSLQAQAESETRKAIGAPHFWYHQNPKEELWHQFNMSQRLPSNMDKAVRTVFGRVAPVLREKKLVQREADWKASGQYGVDAYAYALLWSPEFLAHMKGYETVATKLHVIFESIERLKKEKSQKNTMNRWEKA